MYLLSRMQPACSLAAMATAVAGAAAAGAGDEFVETVAEQLSREVFATYTCRSSAAGHGQPHPGDIAEPSSLAAIPLPPTDYPLWDSLGGAVAAQGKLSQLQLEGVMYACAKHLTWLPSGERCGFFIGKALRCPGPGSFFLGAERLALLYQATASVGMTGRQASRQAGPQGQSARCACRLPAPSLTLPNGPLCCARTRRRRRGRGQGAPDQRHHPGQLRAGQAQGGVGVHLHRPVR